MSQNESENRPLPKVEENEVNSIESDFRKILNLKLLGLFFFDTNLKITKANDFFLEIIGYTRQDIDDGKIKWNELTPPEYVLMDQQALEQIKITGNSESFEKKIIRKDGSKLAVIQGMIRLDENTYNYGAFIIPVSNDKIKSNKELNKSIKDLEQKVSEKTVQLEVVNQELESLSYSVSHDLRAPLRAVNGYSKMLKDEYENILDKNGARLLNNIVSNANTISELIDSILKFSRLGRKLYNPTLIDINKVVDESIKELDKKDGKVKNIIVHDLGKATADYSLIKEAFIKLIDNAIKFTSKKDKPLIEIGCKEVENNKKAYFIKDNGAGFDMAYAGKLFRMFQRLHSHEEFEGTGTGLATAKRIISRHGGDMWAEGKENEGATFYFTLNSSSK